MTSHKTGTREEWLAARLDLLEAEKALTRRTDDVARQRQELPWVSIGKQYRFDTDEGSASLADLFQGRSQLLVYHFMFGPDYTAGCPSCSAIADGFSGSVVHLAHHDVTLTAVSRAPLAKIQAYKRRMGWSFPFASSYGSDFNYDYQVSMSKEELGKGEVYYNYSMQKFPSEERPGTSVFYKDAAGNIYHTYSSYARGLDPMIATYQWLDLTPKGRDEDSLAHTMAWVRHHDKYVDGEVVDVKAFYVQPARTQE